MFFKNKIRSIAKKKTYSNFFLSLLFILTFLLILFNKTDYLLVNKIKHLSIDIIVPTSKIISSPVIITSKIINKMDEIRFLQKENYKLKEEIIRLKKWQTLALKNTRENVVLKKLLNSTTNEIEIIKTASVISQTPDLYSKTITINAGKNFKVLENLAVINEKGLIGKILTSTGKNSKIILISDQNSSVPVRNISGNSFAILKGSSDGRYLISAFIKDDVLPKIGELLVTSGTGKLFPKDILVGKVVQVNDDNFIALPYVNFENLDYVQVVDSR